MALLPFQHMGVIRGVAEYPDDIPAKRGVFGVSVMPALTRALKPEDAIGTVQITLDGVKNGSEVKIISWDNRIIDGSDSTFGKPVFNLPTYTYGSMNNDVRIVVMNLGYEILDFIYTLPLASTSVKVFQRIDRNYRNPS